MSGVLFATICCCAFAQLPPKRGTLSLSSDLPNRAGPPNRLNVRNHLDADIPTWHSLAFRGGSGCGRTAGEQHPTPILSVSSAGFLATLAACCLCFVAAFLYLDYCECARARHSRMCTAIAMLVDCSAGRVNAPEQPCIDTITRWSGVGTFAEPSGTHQHTTIELTFRQTPLPAAPAVAAVAGVGRDKYGEFECHGIAGTCSNGREVAIAIRKAYTDGVGLRAQRSSHDELEYHGVLTADRFEGKWKYTGIGNASGSFLIERNDAQS